MQTEGFVIENTSPLPMLPAGDAAAGALAPYEFRSIAAGALARNGACRLALAEDDLALSERIDAARREEFEKGRRQGDRAARAEVEAAAAAAIAQQRDRVTTAVEEFCVVRSRYFSSIEGEIVRLALAIAGHVLHREAQLDPLLLAGVVRVALDRLSARSGVILRVPPTDVSRWEAIFHEMESANRPSVVAGPSLAPGECVLETAVGVVELGIAAQLEEIERGFFDLLQHRPSQ